LEPDFGNAPLRQKDFKAGRRREFLLRVFQPFPFLPIQMKDFPPHPGSRKQSTAFPLKNGEGINVPLPFSPPSPGNFFFPPRCSAKDDPPPPQRNPNTSPFLLSTCSPSYRLFPMHFLDFFFRLRPRGDWPSSPLSRDERSPLDFFFLFSSFTERPLLLTSSPINGCERLIPSFFPRRCLKGARPLSSAGLISFFLFFRDPPPFLLR